MVLKLLLEAGFRLMQTSTYENDFLKWKTVICDACNYSLQYGIGTRTESEPILD